MSNKYVDFDAMWAEALPTDKERPKIKVFGEEIILPSVCPVRILLRVLRSKDEHDEEIDIESHLKRTIGDLGALVGADKVEEWIDKGMSSIQLIDVFNHCLNIYLSNYEADGGDGDEGNPPAPKRGARRQPSKRSSKSGV